MHPSSNIVARRAVVLAAGRGTRLRPETDARPKPLVEVGGVSLLARQLGQLARAGVERATVVVGDRAEQVRRAVGAMDTAGLDVDFVEATDYAQSNNAVSLWHAREALAEGCLLLEGDVVMDDAVLDAVLASELETLWAVRPFERGMDGTRLEGTPAGPLERLARVRSGEPAEAHGYKSMGVLRLAPDYGARLAGWLEAELGAGRRDRLYDLVIADHLAETAPRLLVLADGRWFEVDTPDDLREAERAFGAG